MIEKPIFIIGVERSGTTLLYSLLANHPDLYWFSRLDSLFPENPFLTCSIRNIVNRIQPKQSYLAIPNSISRSKGLIPPSECVQYWRRWFPFINENDENENGDDYYDASRVSESDRVYLNQDFSKRLLYLHKKRILLKQPAFSLKIVFLSKVFPDSLFVHVIRNPIDNYHSLLRAKKASSKQYWGSKPPGWRAYQKGDLEHQAYYHLSEILKIIEKDINSEPGLSNRYLLVKYEELLSDPRRKLEEVLNFCHLSWVPVFERVISQLTGQPLNRKSDEVPEDLAPLLMVLAEKYEYRSKRIPDS